MWKKKKVKQIRNFVAIRHNTRAGVCASVVCVSTTNTHTHRERETGTVTVTKRRQAAGSAKRRLSRVARGRLICLNKLCTWITNNSGQRCCLAAETTTHTHTRTHMYMPRLPPCLVWVSLALGRVINVSVVVAKCFSIQIWFYLPTLFLPGGRCRPPFPPPSQCLPSLPAAPFLAGRLAMPGQVPLAGYR